MATKDGPALADLQEQLRGMMAVNPMVAPQMARFWQAQHDILQEAATFADGWFDRRQHAARSARDAAETMAGDGADPSQAMRGVMDWHRDTLDRMAEDMQAWTEFCTRCAGHMGTTEIEAGKEAAQETAKRARAATTTKHSTPV